jgi:glycosyltransferase involved in cell wall biosynthesis
MPPVNWLSTIHHGMPPGLYPFHREGGDYLAFLGRISPEKRADRAIEIAKLSGVPLKIAAKVDSVDREYFKCEIEPLLDHPLIEYIGEIDDRQKSNFLGGALALLFPIDWPEPFGLVMIESMSCGTPVIAWKNGSVPEVIDQGRSGVIVESLTTAAAAVQQVRGMDRRLVRQTFEERFGVAEMAGKYLNVFEQLLHKKGTAKTRRQPKTAATRLSQPMSCLPDTPACLSDRLRPWPNNPPDASCDVSEHDRQPA